MAPPPNVRAAEPADPRLRTAVSAARGSVVRVLGTACGLGIEGSGWVAAPGVVVTNAHVVAGETRHEVQVGGRRRGYPARASRSTRTTTSRCCACRI